MRSFPQIMTEHLAAIRKSFEIDPDPLVEPFNFHDQAGVFLHLLEKMSNTLDEINRKLPPRA
ncbi:hypothetical protein GPX89_40335 [Nocardia sp. ET3-3]|uniref:Uncharacterized protein n=1 Tax=Nocardia terrae TaxID=2675851 RepID=A0A7K1V9Z2_9NOCA|nr:hypothetical protein [Nocardia terrae]MVU83474.1 hypothetical protein [Nocardia terrae]